MTLYELRLANTSRVIKWHADKTWTVTDWSNAAAGELGEMCNAIKKLRRIEDEMPNINERGRDITTREQALDKIGREAADTVIYLDLLMAYLGLSLEEFIKLVFNKKSEEYGFPERLE